MALLFWSLTWPIRLLAIYLLRFYDGNILDDTIGYIGTPDLHNLGWPENQGAGKLVDLSW